MNLNYIKSESFMTPILEFQHLSGRTVITMGNSDTGIRNPENVDKRREEVGLQPLADYVKEWQIKWDVEQYKKDLEKIEAREKAKQK